MRINEKRKGRRSLERAARQMNGECISFTVQCGTALVEFKLQMSNKPDWDDAFEILDNVKELAIEGIMIGRERKGVS